MYYKHRVSVVAGGEWNHSWVLRFINLPWMKIQNNIFQYFPVKNEKKKIDFDNIVVEPRQRDICLTYIYRVICATWYFFKDNKIILLGIMGKSYDQLKFSLLTPCIVKHLYFICDMITLQLTWNLVQQTYSFLGTNIHI